MSCKLEEKLFFLIFFSAISFALQSDMAATEIKTSVGRDSIEAVKKSFPVLTYLKITLLGLLSLVGPLIKVVFAPALLKAFAIS